VQYGTWGKHSGFYPDLLEVGKGKKEGKETP
jgi:hypothetical protein